MPLFLSDEWLAELGAVLDRAWAGAPAEGGSLALGQIVRDAPGGDVEYTMVLGAGAGAAGGVAGAEVTLVESYEVARALASGERTIGEVLAAGAIRVRGDAHRLVEAQPLLERLSHEDVVAGLRDVRDSTTF